MIYDEIVKVLREDADHFDMHNESCDPMIGARLREIAVILESERPPVLVRQDAVDCRLCRCVNKSAVGRALIAMKTAYDFIKEVSHGGYVAEDLLERSIKELEKNNAP